MKKGQNKKLHGAAGGAEAGSKAPAPAAASAGGLVAAGTGAPFLRDPARHLAWVVALVTLLVYLPVLGNDFVSLDDYIYVIDNDRIRSLGWPFFSWALSDLSAGFWHPVTWISFALDYAVWGLKPLGYHLSAALLHALNTLLVFRVVQRLLATAGEANPEASIPKDPAALAAAAVTALLFGLHPLHVESVAWISERKDLLCGTFYLLALNAYLGFAERKILPLPGPPPSGEGIIGIEGGKGKGTSLGSRLLEPHYLLALCWFLLSLASKTMAVSLPVVLLILDWYPLRRARSGSDWLRLLAEKIPFVAASLAIAAASLAAQGSSGALSLMASTSFGTRLLVALKALVVYLGKMVVPLHLIPYYPYPQATPLFSLAFGLPVLLILAATAAALRLARSKPLWLASWAFYTITLLPALGIVQVGLHSMGDRFTYLPSLAPFLLAGLCVARFGWRYSGPAGSGQRQVWGIGVVGVLCVLSFLSVKQIGVWNNSLGLWNYIIERGDSFNPMAYNGRGNLFQTAGEWDRAIADYSTAMAQEPKQPEYLVNRAVSLCGKGDLDAALADFNRALALDPKQYLAFNNRGNLWYRKGEYDRAIEDFTRAAALKPSEHLAFQNRGAVYEKKGEIDRALADYTQVIKLKPLLAAIYVDRGDLYLKKGALDLATKDYLEASALGDRRRLSLPVPAAGANP